MHVTDRIKRALGVCGTWETCPPRKPTEIAFGAVFGVKQDDQLPI